MLWTVTNLVVYLNLLFSLRLFLSNSAVVVFRLTEKHKRLTVMYDFSCGLHDYISNRDPNLVWEFVDVVHDV